MLCSIACSPSSLKILTTDRFVDSPFYPDYYSNNQICIWLVRAPPGNTVAFILTLVNLAEGDYIEIRDGKDDSSVVLKNVTKNTNSPGMNQKFESTKEFLWVRFKTDSQHVGNGFRMHLIFQSRTIRKYSKTRGYKGATPYICMLGMIVVLRVEIVSL